MSRNLTLQHALSKNSLVELKDLFRDKSNEKIDPKQGKPNLIKNLTPLLSEQEREKIIDEVFNKPTTRYTAHLGNYGNELPIKDELEKNIDLFNREHNYDETKLEFQTNYRELISISKYNVKEEIVFRYSYITRKAEYDLDEMETKTITYPKRIRILINPQKKLVSIFTGDRDLFNKALTALTVIFNFPVTPLNINKSGIRETLKGSFSFHTVKVLDFIYHGLSQLGELGEILEIELNTPSKTKKPQQVKVKGNDLLEDSSISEYLFIHARELVGLKITLLIKIKEKEYLVKVDVGLRDNRIKIGIIKEHHSILMVKLFFELLEAKAQELLPKPGLINEDKTTEILNKIRKKVMN